MLIEDVKTKTKLAISSSTMQFKDAPLYLMVIKWFKYPDHNQHLTKGNIVTFSIPKCFVVQQQSMTEEEHFSQFVFKNLKLKLMLFS